MNNSGVPEQPKVYHINPRVPKWKYESSLPGKLEAFLGKTDIFQSFEPEKPTPVKIHFGSEGAFRGVRPVFIRKVVERLYSLAMEPFVVDTVRIKGPAYLRVARDNGYSSETLGAPVFLADGIFGLEGVQVDIGDPMGKVSIASAIHDAWQMVVVTHCKGHIQAGFGGAIKNISMGCVSAGSRDPEQRPTRGLMHSPYWDNPFVWKKSKCTHCNACIDVCPLDALYFENEMLRFGKNCWKCTRCARVCPTGALISTIPAGEFQERLALVAKAVLDTFRPGKIVYVNVLMDVAPECDCMPASETPVLQDQGILISNDPVAVDKASLDMLNKATPLPGSTAEDKGITTPGDVFQRLHNVNGLDHIKGLADLGVGSLEYELVKV